MSEPEAKKKGRPSKFTQKLADTICIRLAQGESMRSVLRDEAMPSMQTVWTWLRNDEVFLEQYTRAKQESADAMADEIIDIADDGSNDWMETFYPNGKPKGWEVNGEAVQRSKLRLDTRKFLMAKMKPKKYGERLNLEATGEIVHKFEDLTDEQLETELKKRKNLIA